MIVSIHQPNYLPYLGLFHKIAHSDVFIFLDDAQYSNEGMHNWNRIKSPQGEVRLKVPVTQHLGDRINDVNVRDDLGWASKHLKSLKMNYARAKFFDEIYSIVEHCISMRTNNKLSTINEEFIEAVSSRFGFSCKFHKASELPSYGVREEKVISLVNAVGGTTYYSGTGAAVYQVPQHFEDKGIRLVYTSYRPVAYEQQWAKLGFMPNLSVVDYLMNHGFDRGIFE